MAEAVRAPASAVGNLQPFRPMKVESGVLCYVPDGTEVCLCGVNYYAEDGNHWESHGQLTERDRLRIDQDLDDMVSMGVDIIRFHIFDTELSDRNGNLLLECPYFDKYDYIIKACSDRGIYVFLTPIAIFNGRTGTYGDSFCNYIPRPAIVMWEAMWPAQTNYLYQILTRTNPYTGNRLIDEPNVALIELVNEPDYCSLGNLLSGEFDYNWVGAERGAAAMADLQAAWLSYAPNGFSDDPDTFAHWRYKLVCRYLKQMITTVQSAGPAVWKPLGFNRPWAAGDELPVAIAGSGIEILTLPAYSDTFDHVLDDETNQLLHLKRWNHFKNPLPACYSNMARTVYEFDGPQTVKQIEMIPAIIRQRRWQGAQIMCYFQYDPLSGAAVNRAWPDHYMNLRHTPERAAAYMIGREYFHRTLRGVGGGDLPDDDWVFPPAAVSHARNAAMLCDQDIFMSARETDWMPLEVPTAPERITCVGNSPYFNYSGSGVVDVRIDDGELNACFYPDVERCLYALSGTDEDPLTVLHSNTNRFELLLSGWQGASVQQLIDGEWQSIGTYGDSLDVVPGEYRLIQSN